MFEWGVSSLTFSGGETIQVEPGSILIFVGPNNSGKSSALRGIEGLLHIKSNPKTVIQDVQPFCRGSEEDLRLWLEQSYRSRTSVDGKEFFTKGAVIPENHIVSTWHSLHYGGQIGELAQFLLHRLDTESRLQLGNPVNSQDHSSGRPGAYIHILQSDEGLLKKVSAEIRKAFGVDFIINWGGGGNVWFHVGDEPIRTREKDRVSFDYLKNLNELPRLEYEGDGIRSFVGTLLATLCGAHPILLIDEPEAFLHPPQIRRLASVLARSAERLNRQIIVATHSSEVIHGALAASKKVSICRITRQDSINHGSLLGSSQVKTLWSEPLLRSASAIDGIFYEGVIVCEADTDCRFYDSLAKRINEDSKTSRSIDIYFIHGGGKGSLAKLASTYQNLSVPVAVVADFDLLRNKGEFVNVMTALGADFTIIEKQYDSTVSALNNIPPSKSLQEFLGEARSWLDEIQLRDQLTNDDIRLLMELLSDSGDWSEAKRYGINKLSGGAHQTCSDLLNFCKTIGLFVVPSGELESWWRGGPRNKNDWSNAAIEKISSETFSFREAQEFMLEIINYLM